MLMLSTYLFLVPIIMLYINYYKVKILNHLIIVRFAVLLIILLNNISHLKNTYYYR